MKIIKTFEVFDPGPMSDYETLEGKVREVFEMLKERHYKNDFSVEVSDIGPNLVSIKAVLVDRPWEDVQIHGDVVSKITFDCELAGNYTFVLDGTATETIIEEETDPSSLSQYEVDGIDVHKPNVFEIDTDDKDIERLIERVFFEEGYK
jgi:hypothetical protein